MSSKAHNEAGERQLVTIRDDASCSRVLTAAITFASVAEPHVLAFIIRVNEYAKTKEVKTD